MTRKKGDRQRRLTPTEVDRLIELKLDRTPVRTIAADLECAINTVQKRWHEWLDEQTDTRNEVLQRHQTEIVARLDSVATQARRGAIRARDDSDAVGESRFLAEERQALREIGRVTGLDSITIAASLETSILGSLTDSDAVAALASLPASTLAQFGLSRA